MITHRSLGFLKALIYGAVTLLALGAMGYATAQTAEGPSETVAKFSDSLQSGDVAAALDLTTDDIVYVFPPCIQAFGPQGCQGKDQLDVVLQKVVQVNGRVTVLEESVQGSTVVQSQEARSQTISAAGVDRILVETTWELRDGLIARVTAVPDVSDPQTARFLAATVAMAPPATGDGGLADDGRGSPGWVLPAVLCAAIAAGVYALLLRRRRA